MKKLVVLGLLAGAWGCEAAKEEAAAEPVDLRVAIPAASPEFVDLVSGEYVIQPGEDKMFCEYFRLPAGESFAVNNMEMFQGKYGHHIVVLKSSTAQPDGAALDCSDSNAMKDFEPFILPDTELPEGFGMKVEGGEQLIFQIHYVNAGLKPIRVRDVGRLRKIDEALVTTWVSSMNLNQFDITIPAGEQALTQSFDCTLEEDTNILLLGGHMHEGGTVFEVHALAPDQAEPELLYVVDPWKPDFRDAPPVSLFFESPKFLPQGTRLTVSCTWKNDTTEPITFPQEMCAAFGYTFGTTKPINCNYGAETP